MRGEVTEAVFDLAGVGYTEKARKEKQKHKEEKERQEMQEMKERQEMQKE